MNATTTTSAASRLGYMPILFVLAIGTLLMTVTGHAQTPALHDAAHDMRHATGFPCH